MSGFFNTSYLFGSNAVFIEELYQKYLEDPKSIDSSWSMYFSTLEENNSQVERLLKSPSWQKKKNKIVGVEDVDATPTKTKKTAVELDLSFNFKLLVEAYRANGHLLANLDPLDLEKKTTPEELHLDPSFYGFKEEDLNKEIALKTELFGKKSLSVKELLLILREVYCNKIGFEVAHIHNTEQRDWLYQQIENLYPITSLDKEKQKEILNNLIEVESFEQFLHSRFPGAKRFSVEGGEASIIAIDEIIKVAAYGVGIKEVIIGMAHRGRLSVLTKIMGKSYCSMLSEFKGNLAHKEDLNISGDVKYHLGKSTDYSFSDGKNVHLSLTANPSHLEAVNPVVAGKVRAKQDLYKDTERTSVMGLLIHGDAAFAGQGVVAESLTFSDLKGYSTGGTMHIVINNQVGFTTGPDCARASRYPTEVAKIIQAPIFHVNGDDAEAVVKVAQIAEKFRAKFKKDVVIDVMCYRLYGHNEGDEPLFTQPIMYKYIREHKTCSEIYAEKLISQNVITEAEVKEIKNNFYKFLDSQYEASTAFKPEKNDWLENKWLGLRYEEMNDPSIQTDTGVELNSLKLIGKALHTYPEDFNINSKLEKLLDQKARMLETGKDIDWAMAEGLAYGSLLTENTPVRLSGQDVGRGTFSHRHSVFTDQVNENKYIPLNNISETQAKYEVINSNLSEYAVLGFEHGYSLVDPNSLVIWEAQFGDFSNGAQIMIDQFISASEEKWLRMSGLVMLLPHGFEGMGPEHSSARLERYLQLCAQNNMQVVSCTTPANFFHVIRRQIKRITRKPLIVMSPKSLLRHRLVVSDLKDFVSGTSFKPVISEISSLNSDDKIRKVIITSGKVYYDLFEEREKRSLKDIAIIRLEQYYPFPEKNIAAEIRKYKNAEVVWCQEEPKNMGAWTFVYPYLKEILGSNKTPIYVGREASASPAVGYLKLHNQEQSALVNKALA